MRFSILPLGADDWGRNRAIRLRALADTPDAFGSTLADARQMSEAAWRQRLTRTDSATFVATTTDQKDVGLIVGAPYDDEMGLYSMWVAPAARQQGVGGALVDAVIAWARQSGRSKLVLDVGDENHAAIALYVSRGFRPNGRTGTLPPPRDHILEHQRVLPLAPSP